MSTIRIVTNGPSQGAVNLKNSLVSKNHRVFKVRNSVGAYRRDLAIKWGCFELDNSVIQHSRVILNDKSSDTCLNKLKCFVALEEAGVPIPKFTNDINVARDWLIKGERVYVRKLLRSSAGEGIEVVEGANSTLPDAPLYTMGMKGKRREYRIHVFGVGSTRRIFIQQKLRRRGFQENENYTNLVRNLDGGWVFAHEEANIQKPRDVTVDAAVGAIKALGLDFGAVDLIEMDKHAEGSVVLEVNTAPGLEGTTCEFYADAINEAQRELASLGWKKPPHQGLVSKDNKEIKVKLPDYAHENVADDGDDFDDDDYDA